MIDVQEGFKDSYWGQRNNPSAESKMAALLSAFRGVGGRVFHVQHMSVEPDSPLRPDRPGNEFMDFAKPIAGERLFQKDVNSAFIGTRLENALREERLDSVVIAGLTTDHCVSTSARMAANLGFKVHVVADATATFDRTGFDGNFYEAEQVHALALASLHREFATVLNCSELMGVL
jgi:nicotinamidase-related amidase